MKFIDFFFFYNIRTLLIYIRGFDKLRQLDRYILWETKSTIYPYLQMFGAKMIPSFQAVKGPAIQKRCPKFHRQWEVSKNHIQRVQEPVVKREHLLARTMKTFPFQCFWNTELHLEIDVHKFTFTNVKTR